MEFEIAKWLWEQFGNDLSIKARKKWAEFNWGQAEIRYKNRLKEQHSKTRLFGHPKAIEVDEIFTDVYVLDKLTAFNKFGLQEIQKEHVTYDNFLPNQDRKPALRITLNNNKVFILGKPGAGKTTFLKYIVLKACENKISKTPIFVSLKEWSDSGIALEDYFVKQFEICAFPDAKAFIEQLLKSGEALLLFDGLDEVRQEDKLRAHIIEKLRDFSKEYAQNQIFITCRVAAVDYVFEQFMYLEIADFDERQTNLFVKKWYQGQYEKTEYFLKELDKPENQRFKELTRTPLLLALLCLAFDELLSFPLRRVDLYKEAFDALLRKWDATRGIKRDEIYRGLSPIRKEQLLSKIAFENFKNNVYFFREENISKQIADYLEQMPAIDTGNNVVDGNIVLKAIQAQHGILTERSYGVYSFSHLTFQEYLSARFIVQNAASGTLSDLVKRISLDRWHEVIFLTVSLLDNADIFFGMLQVELGNCIKDNRTLESLFEWVNKKSLLSDKPVYLSRAILLLYSLLRIYALNISKARSLAINHRRNKFEELNLASRIARLSSENIQIVLWLLEKISLDQRSLELFESALTQIPDPNSGIYNFQELGKIIFRHLRIDFGVDDFEKIWALNIDDMEKLEAFLNGTHVMLRCLELATVSNRSDMQNQILLPSVSA